MVKSATIILASLLMVACATPPVKLKTETVEVYKPILYCPAPNWDETDRPNPLAIDSINRDTPDGEVAKRYKATVRQLQDYVDRLEQSLMRYDTTNEAYEQLRQEFIEQRNKDGFEGTPD